MSMVHPSRRIFTWVYALLVFAALGAASDARASDIGWNFGTSSGAAEPSSGLPADVSGGTVTQGNNNGTTTLLTTTSASNTYAGASGQYNAGAAARTGALNKGANGSAYFEFTLTPANGSALTLSALSFGSRSTNTGPAAFTVFTSLDGYDAPVASGTLTVTNNPWLLYTPTFTTVTGAAGAAVTVRIYGYNGSGNASVNTANWRIDDLKFTVSTSGGGTVSLAVTSTTPANNAAGVTRDAAIAITFNKPATVTGTWFTITGSTNGEHTAAVAGGPTTYTLTPSPVFNYGETVTVTLHAAQIAGLVNDHDFTFTVMSDPGVPTLIHAVQGNGATSPLQNQTATIQGVVTGFYLNSSGTREGLYLQEEDADADADPATSEGIYVFMTDNTASLSSALASLAVGDQVTVRGTVKEYNGLTELATVSALAVESSGHPLPGAVELTLPLSGTTFLERYEGMRVALPQTLTVTDTYPLRQYGEFVLSSGGLLPQPTNIAAPGTQAAAVAAANLLNQIAIDDGSGKPYPSPTPYLFGDSSTASTDYTLRGGDTTTGVTGVLTTIANIYMVEPTETVTFTRENPRSAPPEVGGRLKVVSANVLNFFNGNGTGGGFPTARGASSAAEFQRQRAHIIAAFIEMDADIYGLIELENDGFGSMSAIQDLVNGMNTAAVDGTTYAFVNPGVSPVGTDEITCGFIYRTDTVALVGAAAVNTNSTFSRPPIAQTFEEKATGETLTVCVNHFKSKGSAPSSGVNADQGDGQGAWNAQRIQQATLLASWLATDPTGSDDPDALIIGDLNAYAKEDPITTLLGAAYTNLVEAFEGVGGYSYSFGGQWGHLDHALSTAALVDQVTGAESWHNNSAEPTVLDYNVEEKSPAQQTMNDGFTPWRASDHDPVIIGLALGVGGGDDTTAPTITSATMASGTYGAAFSYTITADEAVAAYAADGLPAGLSLDTDTGVISGTPAAAGSFNVTLGATDAAGNAGSTTLALTIAKASATVTLGDLAATYDGSAHAASATTTPGGLSVALTYDGSASVPTDAGSYAVVATVSDANYTGGASGTLTIAKADQTVSFAGESALTIGAPLALSATASSGLEVAFTLVSGEGTLEGGTLTATSAASDLVVRATQAGDNNHHPASADRTFTVNKLDQTIVFAALADQLASAEPLTLAATASSGLDVTFTLVSGPATLSGNTLTLAGAAGTVVVRASQAGNDVYNAADDVDRSFAVTAVGPQVYFGQTESNDTLAGHISQDNSRGTLIGYLAGSGQGFVVEFNLGADGKFEATANVFGESDSSTQTISAAMMSDAASSTKMRVSVSAATDTSAPATVTFTGTVIDGVISGTIAELDLPFALLVEPPSGGTADIAGYYTAASTDTATGTTYLVVGTTGDVYVLVVSSGGISAGSATLSDDGAFTATTTAGATVSAVIDAPAGTVSGTITHADGASETIAGTSTTTVRTDRLINLSARAHVGSGERVLIAGFIIGGDAPKRVLLRAVGPGLTGYGLSSVLPNPSLKLYRDGTLVLENDDWGRGSDYTALVDAIHQTGAFPIAALSKDAALVATLGPGVYTAIVEDKSGNGIALVEVYDAGETPEAEPQRLVNISARGNVGAGDDVLIGGFVVAGNTPKKLLIRGVGPGLTGKGVGTVLANPALTLFDHGGAVIGRNDDWGTPFAVSAGQTPATADELAAAADDTGAFTLAGGSLDSALIVTLAPGTYTVHLGASNGGTGIGLMEIYEIPSP